MNTTKLVENSLTRKSTTKTEYYKEVFDLIVKLFDGCNYKEIEEFSEYIKEMAKYSSKTKSSFNAIRGVENKPFYENKNKLKKIISNI